jgi:uncharacterized protein YicC (UPF0701 family)
MGDDGQRWATGDLESLQCALRSLMMAQPEVAMVCERVRGRRARAVRWRVPSGCSVLGARLRTGTPKAFARGLILYKVTVKTNSHNGFQV